MRRKVLHWEVGIDDQNGENQRLYIERRLLTERPYNQNALARMMKGVWKPVSRMEMKKLGSNVMLFDFFWKG